MWQLLLHRIFGITADNAGYGKMGGGVMAFTAWVTITFCGAAGGIAWALSHDPYFALGAIAITGAVVAFFLHGTWKFADKHPDQAALGGAWWYKFREIQMAAKGQPELPPSPSISDPTKPLPIPPLKLLDSPDTE